MVFRIGRLGQGTSDNVVGLIGRIGRGRQGIQRLKDTGSPACGNTPLICLNLRNRWPPAVR